VLETIELLDNGKLRVAEKADGKWVTNEWQEGRAAVVQARRQRRHGRRLLSLLRQGAVEIRGLRPHDLQDAGFRVVPPAAVRYGAHIAKNVVLMPSFVNIGAYVDEGTMVDTWATVGSCAQIGKNVHLSGGVGIGGVLEPLQANPTIIEDNCFVGARSEIVEGVIVEEAASSRWASSSARARRSTARYRRGALRPRAAGLGRRVRVAALARTALQPLLRGHREAGRRRNARQDEHQRAPAQRLITCP
jgi:2,3,4,5-tetrahydropyridine-2,6-dicarboxylate N-succinyltransferase